MREELQFYVTNQRSEQDTASLLEALDEMRRKES